TLWVVDAAAPSVSLVDEATSAVTGTVPLAAVPAAIAVDAAHHKAYVGSPTADTVTVVDGTAKTASSIAVPTGWGTG
ncbi:hypothetical protein SB767_36670, partial [Bacillus sp. SIMBA_069]